MTEELDLGMEKKSYKLINGKSDNPKGRSKPWFFKAQRGGGGVHEVKDVAFLMNQNSVRRRRRKVWSFLGGVVGRDGPLIFDSLANSPP